MVIEALLFVGIVLIPDLVKNMFYDLFLVFLTIELSNEFSCLDSLFIWLSDEDTKENFRNVLGLNIFQIDFLAFIIGDNHILSISLPLVERSCVIISWLFLVQKFTGQINNME